MLNPCINCEEREVSCHGSCGAYKEWRKSYDSARASKWKDSTTAAYLSAWKRKQRLHEQRHKRK